VAPAESDSVATTVGAVQRAVAAGLAPTDIAVLTRVNSLLAPVQVALHGAGVPVDGGVGVEFADRTAVRAELAWLRLATADGDALRADDIAEALRRPSRSMHPRVAEWVGEQRSLAGLRRLAERVTNERDAQRIGEFTADIERLQRRIASGGTTADVVRTVRDQMGLATTIATLDANRRGMNRTAQQDDLTAITQLASLHADAAGFEPWLRRALGVRSDAAGVTLATVHRVKGQEWPFVIVHHADADQFPHRLAEDDEEERRLFHVAITRAARDVLVVPSDRPSPFIVECSTEPSAMRPQRAPTTTSTPPRHAKAKPGDGLSADDRSLFEALRETRRHLAAGKPAYVVLPDTALHDIASARPSSLDQLGAVRGVGPTKLAQYGEAILRVVADHPPAGKAE
jgi:DNA helicase-2/ATP-dependent DNA helicase PcrA